MSDDEIRDANASPLRVFDLDNRFAMIIGANRAAIVHEIGVVGGVPRPSSFMQSGPATSS